MPTYEYQCNECKVNYDLRQSFSSSTTHVCEKCNKGTAKRILNLPTVVFKGSGFYVTDSKNKSKSDSSTKSTSPPNDSDVKSATSNSDKKSSSDSSS